MANLRVDQFTPVTPPLTDADILPIVPQPGTTAEKVTLGEVKSFITEDLYVLMIAGVFN